jgi:hypothetical protein
MRNRLYQLPLQRLPVKQAAVFYAKRVGKILTFYGLALSVSGTLIAFKDIIRRISLLSSSSTNSIQDLLWSALTFCIFLGIFSLCLMSVGTNKYLKRRDRKYKVEISDRQKPKQILDFTQKIKFQIPKWFRHEHALMAGLLIGMIFGAGAVGGGGYGYLWLTKNSLSVRDGSLVSSTTNDTTTTTQDTSSDGDGDVENRGDASIVTTGDSSPASREETTIDGDNNPSIQGNYGTITTINNQDLPGFVGSRGYSGGSEPPDLSKYTEGSDLKQDAFIRNASDYSNIYFEEDSVSIEREIRTSYFRIDDDVDSSNFVFKLEGSQKAALFQFGLADLTSGTNTSTVYTVKFFADGELLWAGECRRSQDSQLISVPLDIPGAETLVIEVTNESPSRDQLYFTKALLLRD